MQETRNGRSRDLTLLFQRVFRFQIEMDKVSSKLDDAFFCGMLQQWDFLVAPLQNVRNLQISLSEVNAFCFINHYQGC